MGERWLQQRARNFEQHQDRAYERELRSANLYSHQKDVLRRSFACEGRAPMDKHVNELVRLEVRPNGVRIFHGNAEVGAMTDAETSNAAEAIGREPHCPGFALGRIIDASSILGEFHVQIVDHSKDDK